MPKQSILKRLLKDESGASAIEYGLIIAMISVALIGAMQGMAVGVGSVWSTASTQAGAVFGTSA